MGILDDARFAVRWMRRSPGFTLSAVAILALGIGASAAIFTLADAVLLRRLPVRAPETLVLLSWTAGKDMPADSFYGNISTAGEQGRSEGNAFSLTLFEELRAASAGLVDLFAFAELERVNVGIDGRADLATGMLVSGRYFEILGVRPTVGRALDPADDRVAGDFVAMLSDRYWSRRFGRDPAVVGRVIRLNGRSCTVVGVAPRGFAGTLDVGSAPDLFVPVARQPELLPGPALVSTPGAWWLQVMGRASPGATSAGIAERLSAVLARSASVTVESARASLRVAVAAGARGPLALRQEFSHPILVLALLVGVVLLVAAANVAALVLARAEGRRREIAVRLALGASRARLVRQLLTESVLLALAAGAAGWLLARWSESALPAFLPAAGSALVLDLHAGARIAAFTTLLSLVTGVLFGVIPAVRATRADLTPNLKSRARRRRGIPGTGELLVVAQVALSLLLTLGGALFARTLVNLEREDPGFNTRGLLLFKIDPTLNGYEGARLSDLYARVLTGLDALGGVSSATASRHVPLGGSASITDLVLPGIDGARKTASWVYYHTVRPNFLDTMQTPLVRGRNLGAADVEGAPRVAVVNEALIRSFFPDAEPLGAQVRLGSSPGSPLVTIVGVVKDARYARLRDGNPPTLYVPYAQHPSMLGSMTFEIRTSVPPASLAPAVRRVVESIDPNLPLYDVRTAQEQVAQSIASERQFSRLATLLAGTGLLLAAAGLYGTLAYGVARRRREIGIRMALGARAGDVARMVLRDGLRLVVVGAGIGLCAALAAGRIVASLLYGVAPSDPAMLLAACGILFLVSLVAGYLPARGASRLDPAQALRCE